MYDILYVDPPWKFNNKKTGGSMKSGASTKYPVMSLEELKSLPIDKLASDNCFLFMWWISSQPKEAIQLAEAWGFKVKNMTAFNWVKKTKKDNDYFGMGFYTRAGSEQCLIAVKGKPKVVNHGVRSVVHSTIDVHSKKPDEVRQRIVKLCGDIPRVELFARNHAPGWLSIGNEIDGEDIRDLLITMV